MSDDFKPILLTVTTGDGEVVCSGHDSMQEAIEYGRFLVFSRGCSGYVIERPSTNALVAGAILEVYP